MSRRRTKFIHNHLRVVATIERHEQDKERYISGYTMRCGCWSEQPEHTCTPRAGAPLGCTCQTPDGAPCEHERGVAS